MRPLSDEEINEFMKLAGNNKFLGVFSKDKLPAKISDGESVVINLQNFDEGSGSHWTCVYNDPDKQDIEYFDSYGFPGGDEIKDFMKTSGKKPTYCTNEIQSLNENSIVCGYYCIYYILSRIKGIDKYDVVYNKFTNNNAQKNDKTVIDELKKILLK